MCREKSALFPFRRREDLVDRGELRASSLPVREAAFRCWPGICWLQGRLRRPRSAAIVPPRVRGHARTLAAAPRTHCQARLSERPARVAAVRSALLEPEPGAPHRRSDSGGLGDRCGRHSPGRAGWQSGVRHLDRVVLERLGPALQRARRAAEDRVWGGSSRWSCWGPESAWRGCSPGRWLRSWSRINCGDATWRISRWRTTWSSATGVRAGWPGSARSTARSSRTSARS